MVSLACELLDVRPARCVVIGDIGSDVDARAVGRCDRPAGAHRADPCRGSCRRSANSSRPAGGRRRGARSGLVEPQQRSARRLVTRGRVPPGRPGSRVTGVAGAAP
ncbi:MAG: hypothetical protein WKF47_14165 [Geodermatophilaceae bacterium]